MWSVVVDESITGLRPPELGAGHSSLRYDDVPQVENQGQFRSYPLRFRQPSRRGLILLGQQFLDCENCANSVSKCV